MRRHFGFVMACLLTGLFPLVGCSTEGDLAVEIVPNADFEAGVFTFTATGEAVDEGLMCDSGDWIFLGNETVDGDPMPDSMIGELIEAGEDFEMVSVGEFDCADGSGSIVIPEQSIVDPSDPTGAEPGQVVGTWEVRSGSINGDPLEGGGDTISEGNFQESGKQGVRVGTLTKG